MPIEEIDLIKLTKLQLLEKCEELGITRCKSKNKTDIISLINQKISIERNEGIESIEINEGIGSIEINKGIESIEINNYYIDDNIKLFIDSIK